jgi:hypothetical protein
MNKKRIITLALAALFVVSVFTGTALACVPPLEVDIDIKPCSWPNPLNVNKKGVLPVAILGTDDFDVTQVDPASVELEGVSPLRWSWEYAGVLTFKFDAQEVVAALGEVDDGDVLTLELTGMLREEFGSTLFAGEDVVVIVKKK